jgi:hypothetical protein
MVVDFLDVGTGYAGNSLNAAATAWGSVSIG